MLQLNIFMQADNLQKIFCLSIFTSILYVERSLPSSWLLELPI